MFLDKISVQNIRNLKQFTIDTTTQFNMLVGGNGDGKTSFLEALSLLAYGRSFRTHKIQELIGHTDDELLVIANATLDSESYKFGLQKTREGTSKIRINGENIVRQSQLSVYFPMICFMPNSIELLNGSPSLRRKFIDWLVFHVKHEDVSIIYKEYSRVLDQRNKSLKLGDRKLAEAWNNKLIEHNTAIYQMRLEVVSDLQSRFKSVSDTLFEDTPFIEGGFQLDYIAGWNTELDFSEILEKQLDSDLRRRTTQSGIHRDDLSLTYSGLKAKDMLSRGEQKLLVLSLLLAAEQYIKQKTNKQCIWLLDDIAAELDENNLSKLFTQFCELDNQVFMTCVSKDLSLLENKIIKDYTLFHVEQGKKIN